MRRTCRKKAVPIDVRIDRKSFVPLYQQIKDWLLNKIEFSDVADGTAIPSEATVSKVLHVSRGTVRLAFYELRVEGRVVRVKGRGTFIRRS
jgi:GntR family transcriptional regulator